MTGDLTQYDAACRAVAAAKTIDEAKDLGNKAEAIRHYARQAKNRQLEIDASEIRIRAERRLGEMMADKRAAGEMNDGGAPPKLRSAGNAVPRKPTLAEIGVDAPLAHRARQYARIPAAQFDDVLADRRARLERDNDHVTGTLFRRSTKREARDAREAALAERIREGAALLGEASAYGVVLADPPWRYETFSRITGMDRAADNHYPTSTTDEICALAPPAAGDAVCFLWATVPMLLDGLRVLDAWGFAYKSHLIWNKDRIGTGYWSRNKHELLLIGTRGDIPAPAMGTQSASVIDAPLGEHSEKPAVFHEIIESYFPNLPKLEMFARRPRENWDCWGAEADFAEAAE